MGTISRNHTQYKNIKRKLVEKNMGTTREYKYFYKVNVKHMGTISNILSVFVFHMSHLL